MKAKSNSYAWRGGAAWRGEHKRKYVMAAVTAWHRRRSDITNGAAARRGSEAAWRRFLLLIAICLSIIMPFACTCLCVAKKMRHSPPSATLPSGALSGLLPLVPPLRVLRLTLYHMRRQAAAL